VSDHGLHFLTFLVGAGPLGRGGEEVGGVMKMVPINYGVGILYTWDSFRRKIAAPRICKSVGR